MERQDEGTLKGGAVVGAARSGEMRSAVKHNEQSHFYCFLFAGRRHLHVRCAAVFVSDTFLALSYVLCSPCRRRRRSLDPASPDAQLRRPNPIWTVVRATRRVAFKQRLSLSLSVSLAPAQERLYSSGAEATRETEFHGDREIAIDPPLLTAP